MGVQANSDSILVLVRTQHTPKLHVTGRRLRTAEYAMTLDSLIWKIEGDASEFDMHEAQRVLFNLIRDAGKEGIRQNALIELTGRDQGNVSTSCRTMIEKGVISRYGKQGAYYVP